MNTNIMNTQIFHYNKYDLKGQEGHKRSYVLPKFEKLLLNTFIYQSILIKIYMNTNIINTQI